MLVSPTPYVLSFFKDMQASMNGAINSFSNQNQNQYSIMQSKDFLLRNILAIFIILHNIMWLIAWSNINFDLETLWMLILTGTCAEVEGDEQIQVRLSYTVKKLMCFHFKHCKVYVMIHQSCLILRSDV